MKVIGVIPARLASTRLPRKMLREIAGEPLIARVYHSIRECPVLADAIIATDSDEIFAFAERQGFHVLRTSAACRNGTERVHEVSLAVAGDVYVNIQGDELLARAEHIDALLATMQDSVVQVGTLKVRAGTSEITNPHVVKVVADVNGRAVYFSRSTIPFDRDGIAPTYFKHLGMYIYRKKALQRYSELPESPLERSERLEQLRFIENGIAIQVASTSYDTIRLDTEDDVQKAEAILGRAAKL